MLLGCHAATQILHLGLLARCELLHLLSECLFGSIGLGKVVLSLLGKAFDAVESHDVTQQAVTLSGCGQQQVVRFALE